MIHCYAPSLQPLPNSLFRLILLATGIALSAHAEEFFTPAIPGVSYAGTPIEFIKEGFKGTEGPITLPDGSVIFTETQDSRITRITADGTISTFLENSNGSNGLGFNNQNELVSVQNLKPRVGVVYPPDKARTLADQYEGAPFGRPNDIVVGKRAGIFFTDSGANAKPDQPQPNKPAVYQITPAGALKKIASDIERPNGIQLSPDEKVLYVANTQGEHILAYDIATDGSIGPKRLFARLAGWTKTDNGSSSGADGLAVDESGRLYVASNAGIEVFTATGDALGVIPLPKKPQNLAFAGPDKKTLYIVGRGAAYRIALLTPGFKGRAK